MRVFHVLLLSTYTYCCTPLDETILRKFISAVCTNPFEKMPRRIPDEIGADAAIPLVAWAELSVEEFVARTQALVRQVHDEVLHDTKRDMDLIAQLAPLVNQGLIEEEIQATLAKRYYIVLTHLEEVMDHMGVC